MDETTAPRLELDVLSELGAALVHAGLPALRRLRIVHEGRTPLHDLHLDLVADPPFARPLRIDIARLDPGTPVNLAEAHPLGLDAGWLAAREEGGPGELTASLWQGERRLTSTSVHVRLHAPAHWPGLNLFPELIAAWVRPNARALIPVLADADRLLAQATGRAGLDGYQARDPRRAWHLAQAIYGAVLARDLRYIDPPASFEASGQRVRGHDEVLAGLGTCLDLSTLLAALLEQAGLHALVVVVDGHAFPGAWLTDFSLTSPVTDDAALLRKRLALGEAVVFDSSAVTQGVPFDVAVAIAERHLADPTALRALIDVRASRTAGVRPLALEPMEEPAPAPTTGVAVAPTEAPEERFVDDAVDPTVRTRLDAWRSRLLDLSLRNRLLNLRETKQTVRLPHLDLPALAASLYEGAALAVEPRGDQRLAGAQEVSPERVRDAQERGRILVDLPDADLSARLTELYRRSRSSIQESGAHTLYLATGVLRWFESPSAEQPRLAPLLLVPVELRRRGPGHFELVRADDEARINATLLEKIRREFGVDTGTLASIEPTEQGLDAARVLRLARRAIKDIPRWDVLDEAWLGQFSFTKHLMWLDLGAHLQALLGSPVVAHLFGGGGAAFPLAAPLVDLPAVDTDRAPEALLPVVPADPSQLQAIIAARDGSSFVLQGPPGTGKSQTITNLIAQILAEGRTVLFVSEKRAALEVVQRRLEAIGLGPYCLELHSHQSNKREVVRQLGESFSAAALAPEVGWAAHAETLAAARADLDAHAARLAAPTPFGGPVRDVVATLIGLRDVPRLDLTDLAISSLDAEKAADLDRRVARAGARLAEIGAPDAHPWRSVRRATWTPDWARDLVDATRSLRETTARLSVARADVARALGATDATLPGPEGSDRREAPAAVAPALEATDAALPGPEGSAPREAGAAGSATSGIADDPDTLQALAALSQALDGARPLPDAARDDPDLGARLDEIGRWIQDGRTLAAERAALFERFGEPVLALPLEGLRATFAQWATAFFLFAWFALWGPRTQLRAVARGALPDRAAMPAELDRAIAVRDGLARLDALREPAARWLGPLWRGIDTDFDEVERRIAGLARASDALAGFAEQIGVRARDLGPLARATTDPEALDPRLRRALREAAAAWEAWESSFDAWHALAGGAAAPSGRPAARPDGARGRATGTDRPHLPGQNGPSAIPAKSRAPSGPDSGGAASAPTHRDPLDGAPDAPGSLRAWQDALDRALAAPDSLRAWCAARAALDALSDAGLGALTRALLEGGLSVDALHDVWRRSVRESWWEHHLRAVPELASFRGPEHADRVARFADLDERGLTLARAHVAAMIASRVPDLHGPGDDLGLVRRQLQLQRNHLPVRQLFARIGPVLKRIKPCALMSPLSVAQYLDPSLPGYDVVVFDEASQIPPWDAVGAIARGRSVIVVGDSKQLPPTSFFDAADADDEDLDEEEIAETESILDEVVAAGLRQLRLRWHYRSEHESLIAFSNHQYYDNELFTFPSAAREGLGVELRPVPEGFYDRGRSRTNRAEAEAVVAELVALLSRPAATRPTVGVVTFSMAQQRLVQDLVDAAMLERPELQAAFSDDHPEPAFIKNLESVQGDERDVMLFTIGYGPDRAGKVTMNFGPLNRRGGERRLNVAVTRARRRLVVFSTLRADQIDLMRTRAVGVAHLKLFLAYAAEGIAALDRAASVDPTQSFDSPFERQVHQVLTQAGYRVDPQVGVSGYRIDLAVVDPEAPGRYLLAVECDGATYHSARGARERDRLRQAVLENLGWRLHRVWSTDWWYEREATVERLLTAVAEAVAAPRGTAMPAVPPPPRVEPAPPLRAAPDPVAMLGDALPEAPWPEGARPWQGLPELPPRDPEAFYAATERARLGAALRTIVDAAGPLPTDDAYRAVMAAYGLGRLGRRIRETLDHARLAIDVVRRPVSRGEHLWPAGADPDAATSFRYDDGHPRDVATIAPEEVAAAAAWVLERGVSMSREALAREVARIFGASQLGSAIRARMDEGIALLEARDLAIPIDAERVRWRA